MTKIFTDFLILLGLIPVKMITGLFSWGGYTSLSHQEQLRLFEAKDFLKNNW